MKINYASLLTFKSLDMYQNNGLNFPKEFQIRSTDTERTFYKASCNENKTLGCYQIFYNDTENSEHIAEQEMMIWPDADYMYIDNMFTDDNKRGTGLGTCMHLTNIIGMMENNINKIELLSASSAIPFHIKCGFKPNEEWEKIKPNIRQIAEDNTPEVYQYSQDAKYLLKTNMNTDLKSKLANKLLYNYTKKIIRLRNKKEQEYIFKTCINMQLSKKDVLKNKAFYNELFNKYEIDYQI